MLVRRLNAKITRVLRGAGNAPVKKKGNTTPSRLSSEEPLAVLERKYRKDKSAAAALPLAKRLLQQTGNIAKAQQIVNEIPSTDNLHDDETAFILRVQSLNKYLHEDFVLPQRHASYNFIPVINKVLYAVGISPLSVSNGYTSRTHGVATGLQTQGMEVIVAPLPGKPWDKGAQSGFRIPREHHRYLRKVNDVTYSHNPGLRAWEGDFDTFIQVSADAYVREAMIEKPEYI